MKETKEQEKLTKEDLTTIFSHLRKVKVVFTKKDGTERTMICTRDQRAIPKEYRADENKKSDKPPRIIPDHLFSVFDLEKNDQRSFTIDAVTYVGLAS